MSVTTPNGLPEENQPPIGLIGDLNAATNRFENKKPPLIEQYRNRMAEIEARENSPVPEPLSIEELDNLSIPERYDRIFALAGNGVPKEEALKESRDMQITLIHRITRALLGVRLGRGMTPEKANEIIADASRSFMHSMMADGLEVSFQHPNQEDDGLPTIYWCNHQRGGLETLVMEGATGLDPGRRVLKDSLVSIPIMGGTLRAADSIVVNRDHLRERGISSKERLKRAKAESARVADEAAEKLGQGHNLTIYPEGTRSYDGAPQLTTWSKLITPAVQKATQGIEHRDMLLTWNTMAAFPDALESAPFYPMRFNSRAGLSASLAPADGLSAIEMHALMTKELGTMLKKSIIRLQNENEDIQNLESEGGLFF